MIFLLQVNEVEAVVSDTKDSPSFRFESKNRYTLVLDPGHGGKDSGTQQNGVKESDLSLRYTLRLAEVLHRYPHLEVKLTRTKDQWLSLADRVRFAEEAHAQLLVSIHFNSNEENSLTGAEVFFQNSVPMNDEMLLVDLHEDLSKISRNQSQLVSGPSYADSIQNLNLKDDVKDILRDITYQNKMNSSYELSKILKANWWELRAQKEGGGVKIRQGPFRVLTETTMPSVLIELGYLSNPAEAKWFLEEKTLKDIVARIHRALVIYINKEFVDKRAPPTLH